MPVYDKFQLIAYHVPTDGSNPTAKAAYPSQLLNAQRINALKGDLGDEALNQLTRLVGAVELAKGSASLAGDNVLKVFVVPEFYFRPRGGPPPNAYSLKKRDVLMNALKEVFFSKDNNNKPLFQDWLFVFGTIVWEDTVANLLGSEAVDALSQKATDENNGQLKREVRNIKSNDLRVAWNTALILIGGQELYCLDKSEYAAADGIDAKYQPDTGKQDGYGRYSDAVKVPLKDLFAKRTQQAGERFFSMEGLGHFGVEICKEHPSFTLKKAYADWRKKQQNQLVPDLALQVLTACGMGIHSDAVVVDTNRFILKMDGGTVPTYNPAEPRSEVQCVMNVKLDGDEPEAVTCESHAGAFVDVWKSVNTHLEAPALPKEMEFDVDADFHPFKQELVFFEEQPFEYEAPAQQQQQQQQPQHDANAQVH